LLWHIAIMRQISLLLLLLIIGCTKQKPATEQISTDTARQSSQQSEIIPTDSEQSQTILTDTVLNGYSVKFYELTANAHDSLTQQAKATEIIFSSADDLIIERDSCIILKYQNHKADTLCSGSGEYSDKSSIKGFWRENNLILAHRENLEAGYDFFINMEDGSYYPAEDYVLNPQQDFILTYVDIGNFFSSQLKVSHIKNGVFTSLYEKSLGQLFISDPKWISNSDCILTITVMDTAMESVIDRKWYRMSID